mmetsp:Transcript_147372/g.383138  ORF Transcript_147372/g.383138 Transcript_147372/m.383138 type:complete len:129 (+) Transcript_147372:2-388(+)
MAMMGKGGMMGGFPSGAPMGAAFGMPRPTLPGGMHGAGIPAPLPQPLPPPQPLTAATLAALPPAAQKQMLGERLFPRIGKYQPEHAGKITGMMLEMGGSELLAMLDSEQHLKMKVDEAMRVLQGTRAA